MLPREYSIIIHEWGSEVVAVHEVFRKEGRCDPTRPGRTDAACAERKEPAHHGSKRPGRTVHRTHISQIRICER